MDDLAITVNNHQQVVEGITLGPLSATRITSIEFFAIDGFSNNARLVICYTLLALLLSITTGITANVCMTHRAKKHLYISSLTWCA